MIPVPRLRLVPADIDYGAGMAPVRKTLFGLFNSRHSDVINQGTGGVGRASDVHALEFNVENPGLAPWRLFLHCSPFYEGGLISGNEGGEPVAVHNVSGSVLHNAFEVDTAIPLYDNEDFEDTGVTVDDNGTDVGVWTWDKHQYDIKVRVSARAVSAFVEHQSVYSWFFVVGGTP